MTEWWIVILERFGERQEAVSEVVALESYKEALWTLSMGNISIVWDQQYKKKFPKLWQDTMICADVTCQASTGKNTLSCTLCFFCESNFHSYDTHRYAKWEPAKYSTYSPLFVSSDVQSVSPFIACCHQFARLGAHSFLCTLAFLLPFVILIPALMKVYFGADALKVHSSQTKFSFSNWQTYHKAKIPMPFAVFYSTSCFLWAFLLFYL